MPSLRRTAMTSDQRRACTALVLLLPVPSLGTAASMWWWPGTALGIGLFVASKIWIVLLPLGWRLFVERAPLSWSPPRAGGFGPAIGLGAATAAVIVAVYGVARWLGIIDPAMVVERAAQTGLSHRGLYLAGALYWITLNSLMEEYVWRWFCFRQCEVLFGGRAAVGISALGFTLHHIVALAGQFPLAATVLGSFGVFCGGALWSWLYLRYRSVWPCYASHAVVDIPIFAIGYYLIFRTGATG
jgi:membrane protease YdiL (CAAX protease family)